MFSTPQEHQENTSIDQKKPKTASFFKKGSGYISAYAWKECYSSLQIEKANLDITVIVVIYYVL